MTSRKIVEIFSNHSDECSNSLSIDKYQLSRCGTQIERNVLIQRAVLVLFFKTAGNFCIDGVIKIKDKLLLTFDWRSRKHIRMGRCSYLSSCFFNIL